MTATLVRAATPVVAGEVVGDAEDRPLVDSPTTLIVEGAGSSAAAEGFDSPPALSTSRDFFNGCVTTFDLPPYVAMVGPLTATPGLTLADVVKAIAG